ncbi:MAG: hypothetical protein ACRDV4_00080, partial [Acidimicrobiales bacterium]
MSEPSVTTILQSLPPLLRQEPAMLEAFTQGASSLAVPESATAFVLAGMCRLSERHPMLVATPTLSDAQRLANDLTAFLGVGEVELFPPWDTLPFERVSPELATMGQRLRVLWRLGVLEDGASQEAVVEDGIPDNGVPAKSAGVAATEAPWPSPPSVVVAPVRALLQRLG